VEVGGLRVDADSMDVEGQEAGAEVTVAGTATADPEEEVDPAEEEVAKEAMQVATA
jgi:hypothetical protein